MIAELELLVDEIEAGVTRDDSKDSESVFENGAAACNCTNGARLVCDRLGRGWVVGYRDSDHPGTKCGEFAGGHDFAFVDGRYIVDHWVKWVACLSDRSVFDIFETGDKETIFQLYGDRSGWSQLLVD